MAASRDKHFDPREFVTIKPLPCSRPSGEKLQARSKTAYVTCRDRQVFWENFSRRQRQLSRQGYRAATWRPYEEVGEPLYLEPKKLILSSLGQLDERASEATPLPSKDAPVRLSSAPDTPKATKSLSIIGPRTRSREDAINLKKHLGQTRRLVSAVRQGRGYLQLLQREEQEVQEARQKEVKRSAGPHPPCLSSDSDTDLESPVSPGQRGPSGQRPPERTRGGGGRSQSARPLRPFTPVHHALTSPQLQQLPPECVFRQLCCLNWLLEAVTLGRAGRAAPVSTCWDSNGPGESRAVMRTMAKERAIQAKWEQFVAQPKAPRRPPPRTSRASSDCSYLRKTSSLTRPPSSCSSSLATCTTTLGGSHTSLAQGITGGAGTGAGAGTGTGAGAGAGAGGVSSATTQPGEDTEHQSVEESDAEPPISDYLRKLLEEVYKSVAKELYGSATAPDFVWSSKLKSASAPCITTEKQDSTVGLKKGSQRPKSCPAARQLLSSTADRKCSRLEELRTSFEEHAEEVAQLFSDSLEAKAKKRWDYALERLQALCRKTSSLAADIRQPIAHSRLEEDPDKPYSTKWLLVLLGNLGEAAEHNRKLARVLEKLRHFAEERRLRVRPQVFLKVLGSLQIWELCLPDLCVAIEVVREHAVKMSREDYDAWLLGRISGAQGGQGAPHPHQRLMTTS